MGTTIVGATIEAIERVRNVFAKPAFSILRIIILSFNPNNSKKSTILGASYFFSKDQSIIYSISVLCDLKFEDWQKHSTNFQMNGFRL